MKVGDLITRTKENISYGAIAVITEIKESSTFRAKLVTIGYCDKKHSRIGMCVTWKPEHFRITTKLEKLLMGIDKER